MKGGTGLGPRLAGLPKIVPSQERHAYYSRVKSPSWELAKVYKNPPYSANREQRKEHGGVLPRPLFCSERLNWDGDMIS